MEPQSVDRLRLALAPVPERRHFFGQELLERVLEKSRVAALATRAQKKKLGRLLVFSISPVNILDPTTTSKEHPESG